MDERTQKIIDFYAEEYKNMNPDREETAELIVAVVGAINCDHQCSGNCRREGCNCVCGEWHF